MVARRFNVSAAHLDINMRRKKNAFDILLYIHCIFSDQFEKYMFTFFSSIKKTVR